MLKLQLQYFDHLMQRADSLEKTWMLGKIEGRGEGDDRGLDGWMASLTQWTWVWASSGRWWTTGKPGCGSQQGHKKSDTTEQLNNRYIQSVKKKQTTKRKSIKIKESVTDKVTFAHGPKEGKSAMQKMWERIEHSTWRGFPDSSVGNEPPAMQETLVQFLGREDPMGKDRLPIPVFLGFPCGSAGEGKG